MRVVEQYHSLVRSICFFLAILICSPCLACLWDYDTLRDEKRGLPGVAEVLAGQWERHSAFFYRHRIEAMQTKLAATPDDQDALDNLAVAYEKIGDFDHAIAVMLDKGRRFPDQYTTASNLGTFYMLQGDLDRGIERIRKALTINPNAHFGREKYQLMLAEYLRDAKSDPSVLRRGTFVWPLIIDESMLATATQPSERDMRIETGMQVHRERFRTTSASIDAAITGVIGMIRFGTWTNSYLYAALGDLLAVRGDSYLAYRAYQRALDLDYPRPDDLRDWMRQTKSRKVSQRAFDADVIANERAAADRWVKDYQQFEDDLVRSGKDADDEANLAPFYRSHGRALAASDWFVSDYQPHDSPQWIATFAVIPLCVMWLFSWRRRRRNALLAARNQASIV